MPTRGARDKLGGKPVQQQGGGRSAPGMRSADGFQETGGTCTPLDQWPRVILQNWFAHAAISCGDKMQGVDWIRDRGVIVPYGRTRAHLWMRLHIYPRARTSAWGKQHESVASGYILTTSVWRQAIRTLTCQIWCYKWPFFHNINMSKINVTFSTTCLLQKKTKNKQTIDTLSYHSLNITVWKQSAQPRGRLLYRNKNKKIFLQFCRLGKAQWRKIPFPQPSTDPSSHATSQPSLCSSRIPSHVVVDTLPCVTFQPEVLLTVLPG